MTMTWTAEHDDKIRATWGRQFTRTIAHDLGVTKNAVIGRARRLGLANLKPKAKPGEPKVQRNRYITIRETLTDKFADIPKRDSLNIPFFDLEPRHCRFPVEGEVYQTLFCGHETQESAPYCDWHCAMAYVPPRILVSAYR